MLTREQIIAVCKSAKRLVALGKTGITPISPKHLARFEELKSQKPKEK